jgi:pyruvate dehydrogenase phosphatase
MEVILRNCTVFEKSTLESGIVPEATGLLVSWVQRDVRIYHVRVSDMIITSGRAAVGDTWLKIPRMYSQRVLLNLRHEWNVESPEQYIGRIHTPPYVSNIPDVHHLPLPKTHTGRPRDHFLIMCSDGLADLYDSQSPKDMINRWIGTVAKCIEMRSQTNNMALELLRDALGGEDTRLVSRNLTVEMEDKWMDDVTILVQRL